MEDHDQTKGMPEGAAIAGAAISISLSAELVARNLLAIETAQTILARAATEVDRFGHTQGGRDAKRIIDSL